MGCLRRGIGLWMLVGRWVGMRHSRVVVLCPSNVVTGGPEALHQLVDSVNRQGGDAAILYTPRKAQVPEQYRDYLIRIVARASDDDLLVVPEIWPDMVADFPNSIMWWLSVDFSPPQSLDAKPLHHVTQSAYAKDFLAGRGIQSLMLTDYVHPAFKNRGGPRRHAVAVNPAKGKHWIQRFREVAPDIEVVELKGFDRDELVDVLNEVSVFVDFGHHPGRDRLPREAAMCGCTVFINNVGAGRFFEDYMVDDWFRFSTDDLPGLAGKVRAMFGEVDTQPLFVEQVAGQRTRFDFEVRELLW